MSHDLSDAPARREALDPRYSFIVQAPAGSGKTGLLVQRFLLLLARVEAPEEVVAVTFTRKAAAEMRHRVQDALARAGEAVEENPFKETTRQLALAALARDREKGWGLLEHPERFRIATMDSLCASLAQAAPLLSGGGGGLAPAMDPTSLYRQAARATLGLLEAGKKWSGPVEAFLLHLDNDWSKAETMLVEMLSRRDQWLRLLPRSEDQAREGLEASLEQVTREGLEEAWQCFTPEEKEALPPLLRFAAANVLAKSPESSLLPCLDLMRFPGALPEEIPYWLGLCQLLLTKEGGIRKRLTINEGFPPKSHQITIMKSLLAAMEERPDFARTLAKVRTLPPIFYQEEQWTLLGGLMELLFLAAGQLQLVFAEKGEVDFAEVAMRAQLALGAADQPTDLGLYLDYRIRHLLVDEFQDTSVSQFQLVERLIAGWEPGDGRTLFLVGDPMQSIYRFREAEVGLFLRARMHGIGDLSLTPLTLTVNFRSVPQVVSWVNRKFPAIFPKQESMEAGAVPFSPSMASKPEEEGAGVFFHPHDGENEAGEVLAVAREALAQGLGCAVLVRARPHLAQILMAMQKGGIPIRAVEVEKLGEQPVIRDLMALTLALIHPEDSLNNLAVLAAPWCALSLPDLLLCRTGGELSDNGRARWSRVSEILMRARGQRFRKPLRQWVEGVWLELGGAASYPEAEDLAGVPAFFELLGTLDQQGAYLSAGQLQDAVARIHVSPPVAEGPAVSLMTMHKAKGLEFDVVILPGLARGERAPEQQLLLWQERPGKGLLLGPIQAVGGDKDPIYLFLQEMEKEKSRAERSRLFYVAATRARKRLHLFARVEADKPAPGGSFLSLLQQEGGEEVAGIWSRAMSPEPPIPVDMARGTATRITFPAMTQNLLDWGVPPPKPPGVEHASQATMILRDSNTKPGRLPNPYAHNPIPADYHPPASREEVVMEEKVEFLWVGEMLKKVGTVVHFALCFMAKEGVELWSQGRLQAMTPRFRAMLRQSGVAAGEMEMALERVMTALSRTLEDDKGRWLLSGDHQQAQGEAALTGLVGGRIRHVVIDRTFIDDQGIRWIIDYKTSHHQGGDLPQFLDNERIRYHNQLQGYATLMAAWDPGRDIRLGLYFPLLSAWREWSPNDFHEQSRKDRNQGHG